MRSLCLRHFSSVLVTLFVAAAVNAGTFTANLSSAQEVPVNASTATGYARIFLDETAGTITFTVAFNGLTSAQVSAHIHGPAGIGANGPILIDLGVAGGTSGTLTGSSPITPTQIAQMRSHQTYVNVHSTNFPGGEIRGQIGSPRPVDQDGDGRTDPVILNFPNVAPPGSSPITWWSQNSTAGTQIVPFGNANTDFPVPGDFDGDGIGDIAIYRAGASVGLQSEFFIIRSSDNTAVAINYGQFGDQPVARDYDGDGKTDLAVFRQGATAAAQTVWWIKPSAGSGDIVVPFGLTGNRTTSFDSPVPGDYDGDGKFDIAVYRFGLVPDNTLIVLQSSDGVATFLTWGNFQTDYIVPGDYDGDGKYEIARVRTGATANSPMSWYYRRSSDGQADWPFQFGISSDIPVQGDYDGDGRTDIAVYRPGAAGRYWIYNSLTSTVSTFQWGTTASFPVNRFDIR